LKKFKLNLKFESSDQDPNKLDDREFESLKKQF